MQILGRKVLEASRRLPLFYAAHSGRAHAIATLAGAAARWAPPATSGSLATAPWAATQRRGAKMLGSDVRSEYSATPSSPFRGHSRLVCVVGLARVL
jgi:hypothetical protein